jgi:hypothetical protein
MGDFITAPAIGTRLAVDRIAGVDFPISKLAFGAEDTAVQVSEANPVPSHDAAVLAAIEALFPGTGTLPAGAATDAKLELIRALLAGPLTVGLPTGAATSAKQDAASTLLTAIATALAGTLAVSANALPLPAGAATQATLASLLAKTIAAPATEAKQDASNTSLASIVTALAATLSVSATSLPLPTGAATQATLAQVATALAATLNVLPLIKPWTAWAPATANDMRNYAGVEIQVTATAAATFTRSADDATYVAISATVAGSPSASPLAPGFYNLKGGGFLKWAGTGTILIRGYN